MRKSRRPTEFLRSLSPVLTFWRSTFLFSGKLVPYTGGTFRPMVVLFHKKLTNRSPLPSFLRSTFLFSGGHVYLSTNGSLFYEQLTNGSPLLTFWKSTFLFSVMHVGTFRPLVVYYLYKQLTNGRFLFRAGGQLP
jgi:hypothetical protein